MLKISDVRSIIGFHSGIIEDRYKYSISRLLRSGWSVRISISDGRVEMIWGNDKDDGIRTTVNLVPIRFRVTCSCRSHMVYGFVCEHIVFTMIFLRDYIGIDEAIILKLFRDGYSRGPGRT